MASDRTGARQQLVAASGAAILLPSGSASEVTGKLVISSALNRARAHFKDERFYYDGQKICPSPFGQTLEERVQDMVTRLRALSKIRTNADLAAIQQQFTKLACDNVAAVYLSAVSKRLSVLARVYFWR